MFYEWKYTKSRIGVSEPEWDPKTIDHLFFYFQIFKSDLQLIISGAELNLVFEHLVDLDILKLLILHLF